VLFTQRAGGISTVKWSLLDEDGYHEEKIYGGYAPIQEGELSPDGTWILMESWPDQDTNHDIYIYSLVSGELRRLTTAPGVDFDPAWQPYTP
jgi:Tol biopolymer transport system component